MGSQTASRETAFRVYDCSGWQNILFRTPRWAHNVNDVSGWQWVIRQREWAGSREFGYFLEPEFLQENTEILQSCFCPSLLGAGGETWPSFPANITILGEMREEAFKSFRVFRKNTQLIPSLPTYMPHWKSNLYRGRKITVSIKAVGFFSSL